MTEKVEIPQAVATAIENMRERGCTNYGIIVDGLFEPNDPDCKVITDWLIKGGGNDDKVEQPPIKIGDWAARIKTRKIVSCPTDEKDVLFQVVNVFGVSVIGHDGNNHAIGALRHMTPEEIKAEKERQKWAGIEVGDVLVNVKSGRIGIYKSIFGRDSRVAVVDISYSGDMGWFKHECELYAKKVGVSNA